MRILIQAAVLVAVAGVIAFILLRSHAPATRPSTDAGTVVLYSCNAGKTIAATFYQGASKPAAAPGQPPTPGGRVELKLSDGRELSLKQTISADGGRYSDGDPQVKQGAPGAETFVFWGKGNGALVLENNEQKSYTGCIALAPDQPGISLPLFYSNSSAGFSIRFLQGYSVDESYKYQELGPGKDIYGIKFTIPSAVATGTNLAPDSYFSVEEISKAKSCTAGLFLGDTKAQNITDGQVEYSVASSTGAGAGNRYEETVYAIPGTDPCVGLRYFVHYGVIENYPPGVVQEFDKQALLAQFDAIRRTLILVQ